MKKIAILLITILIMSGCTVVHINTKNIDNIVNVVLSKDNKLYNRVGKGYKYYVPRGVTYIDTVEFNEKLYSNGNYYYLYIDAISYYYGKTVEYKLNKDSYYSKEINVNGKIGYLEITKQENKYLIDFMYNYAHIETIVEKDQIQNAVLNCSYILSTVKFNNNVIKIMLNENYFKNKEEKFELYQIEDERDNLLQYGE